MSQNELVSKIELLNEWERIIEEAKAEADAIRDSIKAEMVTREVDELEVGQYVVRYKTVLSSRFDTTAFKREHDDLYLAYVRQNSSKRFSVSA